MLPARILGHIDVSILCVAHYCSASTITKIYDSSQDCCYILLFSRITVYQMKIVCMAILAYKET